MKITGASEERSAYESICASPFTKIHIQPKSRDDLEEEVKVALCKAKVPGFEWAGEWGLLGEIMEGVAYMALTTNTYVEEVEPAAFNPLITQASTNYQTRKRVRYGTKKESHSTYGKARLKAPARIFATHSTNPSTSDSRKRLSAPRK